MKIKFKHYNLSPNYYRHGLCVGYRMSNPIYDSENKIYKYMFIFNPEELEGWKNLILYHLLAGNLGVEGVYEELVRNDFKDNPISFMSDFNSKHEELLSLTYITLRTLTGGIITKIAKKDATNTICVEVLSKSEINNKTTTQYEESLKELVKVQNTGGDFVLKYL